MTVSLVVKPDKQTKRQEAYEKGGWWGGERVRGGVGGGSVGGRKFVRHIIDWE